MAVFLRAPWCSRLVRQFATALLCAATFIVGLAGCTREATVPSVGSAPSAKFRGDSDSPQAVEVVEDDRTLAYVRVQPPDGEAFYVHRDFVNETNGKHALRAASDVFEKPPGEEYYFRLKELNVIRDKIPGLFMTPSGRRVVASWKIPQFQHDGEMAWPVYECLKPDCPGREKGAEHGYLFILPDPRYTVGSNPSQISLERDREIEQGGGPSYEEMLASAEYLCPQCRQRGRPGPKESLQQKFRRYRLPEAEAMWQSLDDEYKLSRSVRVRKYSHKKVDMPAK